MSHITSLNCFLHTCKRQIIIATYEVVVELSKVELRARTQHVVGTCDALRCSHLILGRNNTVHPLEMSVGRALCIR